MSQLIQNRIHDALNQYADAYYNLKEIVDRNPELFPSSAISSGTFAEFYCTLYLRQHYRESKLTIKNLWKWIPVSMVVTTFRDRWMPF